MASLLVCVDSEALQRMRGQRPRRPGSTWRIGAQDLAHPQLGLLDADGLLVVVTVEAGAAVAVAALEDPEVADHVFGGGEAIELDHDITHLLPRLGWRDVGALAGAMTREHCHLVLAREQVDVLRYELDIENAGCAPPAPAAVVADDEETLELRRAAWADPANDHARMVYADRLLDRGDPRGELIALQLARAPGTPPSDRETALVRRVGAACAEPIAPYLRAFELRRGFVAACSVDDAALPRELLAHPVWSTVEELESDRLELVASPALVSARRLATHVDLDVLATQAVRVHYERIVGRRLSREGPRPLHASVPFHDPRACLEVGALVRLRELYLHARSRDVLPRLLESRLGAQLEHVQIDLVGELPDLVAWRAASEASNVRVFGVRLDFVQRTAEGNAQTIALVAFDRRAAPRIVVEVEEPPPLEIHARVVEASVALGRDIARVEVHDLRARTPAAVATRQRALVARLQERFTDVALVEAARRPPLAM